MDSLLTGNDSPLVSAILSQLGLTGNKTLIDDMVVRGKSEITDTLRTPRWRWHVYAQSVPSIIFVTYFFVPWEAFDDQTGRWVFIGFGVVFSLIGGPAVEFLWRHNLNRLRKLEKTHPESFGHNQP